MLRSKLKLSLIEDYICLAKIDKACTFCLNKTDKILSVEKICNNLIVIYNHLFFKLGLMDISFLVLKKEINNMKNSKFTYDFDKSKMQLEQIKNNLGEKLIGLKLTQIEIEYLKTVNDF